MSTLKFSDTIYEIVDEQARRDIEDVKQVIPTKASQLENDTNYVNADELSVVEEKTNEALSIAKGATRAFVYDTYGDMISELNTLNNTELSVNYHIMIRTVNVPDLWVSGISEKTVEYAYTSDDTLIADLAEDGIIQVGYYVLSTLETQKVDLAEYASKKYVEENTISKATFTGIYGQTTYKELVDNINKGYNVVIQKDDAILSMTSKTGASMTTAPYPVYKKDYKHITFSDFVDTDGNTNVEGVYHNENGLYKYYVPNVEDFNRVMISMYVMWSEGNYTNRIDLGGNDKWTGFSIYPSADGSQLRIRDFYSMSGLLVNINITSDMASVSSFVNETFLLQVAVNIRGSWYSPEYTVDLEVYINGVLCGNFAIDSVDKSKLGSYMNIYRETDTDSSIFIGGVNVLDWFDKIKFTSVQEENGRYGILEAICLQNQSGETCWSNDIIFALQDFEETTEVLKQQLEGTSSVYKCVALPPNSTFYLREKGLYLFCGADKDLNLYDKDGVLQGAGNFQIIALFCAEVNVNGVFQIFAIQGNKGTLGMPSIDSLVQNDWNGNAYVKNTGSNSAAVFYMRQNEV